MSVGTRIQSVERACQVLLWLAERPQGSTAKEVAFATRLALPTTYHLLSTLIEDGFVARDAVRRYVLGPSLAGLSGAVRESVAVPEEFIGGLREVAERTGETAHLVAWGHSGMRVLASVEGSSLVRVAEVVAGPYEAAHARANGKVLLAHIGPEARGSYLRRHPLARQTPQTICDRARLDRELDTVLVTGYACDREEYADGVSCVAAPLRREDVVGAALGLSVPAERFARRQERITRDLLTVSEEIEVAASPIGSQARLQEVSAR